MFEEFRGSSCSAALKPPTVLAGEVGLARFRNGDLGELALREVFVRARHRYGGPARVDSRCFGRQLMDQESNSSASLAVLIPAMPKRCSSALSLY